MVLDGTLLEQVLTHYPAHHTKLAREFFRNFDSIHGSWVRIRTAEKLESDDMNVQ